MEALGFIGAILGLVAAIINRKRIVIHRTEHVSYNASSAARRVPITGRKRLKRLAVCVLGGFLCAMVGAASGSSDGGDFMMFPFFLCFMVGAYQLVAITLAFFFRLWR